MDSKTLRRNILFGAFVLVSIYVLQLSIDFFYNKRISNKFTGILKHELDKPIMIFGSSVAYVEFDPAIIKNITGSDAYNMGWDGMNFVQYNCLIKEYLSYEKQCKYVVIVTTFEDLSKNALITRPDLFYAYLSDPNVYASLHEIEPGKIFKAKYVPGYKLTLLNTLFYNQLFNRAATATDTSNGYDPRHEVWHQPLTKYKRWNVGYDEHIYSLYKETINELADKGIKVIIVQPPMYKEGYDLITNAECIKNKYKATSSNKNVYYLDYTTDTICTNKNYFYNYSHLNAGGAAIFSNKFANDLLTITHTGVIN